MYDKIEVGGDRTTIGKPEVFVGPGWSEEEGHRKPETKKVMNWSGVEMCTAIHSLLSF